MPFGGATIEERAQLPAQARYTHLGHTSGMSLCSAELTRNIKSVADPDPGSGAFLNPLSGIGDG
jgi:hypothetical protein